MMDERDAADADFRAAKAPSPSLSETEQFSQRAHSWRGHGRGRGHGGGKRSNQDINRTRRDLSCARAHQKQTGASARASVNDST